MENEDEINKVKSLAHEIMDSNKEKEDKTHVEENIYEQFEKDLKVLISKETNKVEEQILTEIDNNKERLQKISMNTKKVIKIENKTINKDNVEV